MERKRTRRDGRLRVAVYCRVSPDGGDLSNTLEAQREHYTQEIQAHPEWKLAGIFADKGLTGADMKRRPGFNRMMSACKRGSVDVILTRSVTRFDRCLYDVLKTIRSLKAMGVNVVFEKENINTASDNQEFQTVVYDLFATLESKCIARSFIYPVNRPTMR
ncbi:recombinase family protein [Oscillibacter sp. 1-3]|uniref:recombinase family protein n=1 Tax=Oscillibacter sp. 1-3 TaxID=1235797 RepID=UPI00033C3AC1|nr:recombinase family protein [Oscillibacter sp. 1-3]EOS66247.1 hypothetical protein C816_01293 [Oscillibacter sp. 1-3]